MRCVIIGTLLCPGKTVSIALLMDAIFTTNLVLIGLAFLGKSHFVLTELSNQGSDRAEYTESLVP